MTANRSSRPERLRYAFLTALLSSAAALPAFAADADASTSTNTTVTEVVVTATKRSESLQNVPVSIQALTPQVLTEHQVSSFDDYAKLLPSISFQSFGPGQAQPYFRGITSGADGLHSGSQPGTGMYLDETPVTTIANGLDIHLYDIARVEALSGPQGTLFGANSLSGTLRIITNQPSTKAFSASVDAEANTFTGGGPGGQVEGYVNIPISDKIAIRLVGFAEHDGGYIDNVKKTRTFGVTTGTDDEDDPIITPMDFNNAKYVKKNFNTVDTYGGRAALKVELDDNWTVTPMVIYQNQDAKGNFLYNPRLGDLKTADFSPEYNKDHWYQAALTIQGKIGDWDVLYNGGYFNRHVANAADYSYYSVAYDAAGSSSYVTFPDGHGGYLDPDQHFTGRDRYTKETHEFRITSPQHNPLRAIGGVFYSRQEDDVIANYIVSGLAAAGDSRAVVGADNPDDIYFTDITRIDRDFALFGEVSYDLLSNLTVTGGGRYFTVDNTLQGISGFEGNNPFFSRKATEYGETHKINLSWKIDPHKLVYVTYSTGFRPGGVNRRDVAPPYDPDTISNYEAGWKTTWLSGQLRVNGAVFHEIWHDVQFALSPPGFQGVTFIYNVGYAQSNGVEGDVTYRPDEHWTLSASGTVLDAHVTKTFCDASSGDCATKGAELPIQPKYKFNATARYEFETMGFKDFVQLAVGTQGKTRSALLDGDAALLGPTKGFTTADLSAGLARDNWTFEAYVDNLFDTRGILSINTDCSITYCGPYSLNYPNKPRLVGIKLGMKY